MSQSFIARAGLGGSVGLVTRRLGIRSPPGQATFLEIHHEGQLSVSGKRMCTNTG